MQKVVGIKNPNNGSERSKKKIIGKAKQKMAYAHVMCHSKISYIVAWNLHQNFAAV